MRTPEMHTRFADLRWLRDGARMGFGPNNYMLLERLMAYGKPSTSLPPYYYKR